jgi:hypothetical protein
LDTESWAQFAVVEARRIMNTFGLPASGGLEVLEKALALRMYGLINDQRSEWRNGRLRFYMDICRVGRRAGARACLIFPASRWERLSFLRLPVPLIRASPRLAFTALPMRPKAATAAGNSH